MTVLDVSYAQGDIDWSRVFTPDCEGVVIRVSHGHSDDGPRFFRNVSQARHFADLTPHKPWIGYYHYEQFDAGEKAFSAVLPTLAQFPPDYYMLDVEDPPPPDLLARVSAELNYADGLPRRRSGKTWLYSYEAYLSRFGTMFKDRPLWVAKVGAGGSPSSSPPHTAYPWTMWQFTWTEHWPGIPGAVDASKLASHPGGTPLPLPGGPNVPNPVKTIVDPKTTSAWTLQDDGGVITEHGHEFYGAWGSLPAKTRQDAQVARFYDFTLRFDGKPGYTIWVLSKTGATLDYNFPLA